ncbi:WAP, Kazal, immunoglobulin, Kunitz and NTR domain-containing protein 2 [Holothuria leucospilota]|uniref:WAP, Kazal, immunoglobulin, Kunitz and NTR domain-containing protein 2 n=1 Tax=Holothuria leucospilota TaxID=206669 RepID=A0A9Q1C028_HOLLE|nr:WAP, Kazal, immunoglobulin, Kunitz and NTR domain-containing protein 2 [Holothuria leucospilota]
MNIKAIVVFVIKFCNQMDAVFNFQSFSTVRCNQNIDQGFCNANISRWGFNDFTGRCQEFTFGGCGGNTNSFTSERDCVETCGDVCLLPILRGPCDAQLPRWGYNFLTGQCQQFFFGGCHGNRNNYLTQEVCELACVRKFYLLKLFAHGRHLFVHEEINLLQSS